MAQDNTTEGTETQDESTDNELIRSLREQLKEKDKQLKSAPTRESVEAEIRTELERESAISEQLVALGHPKGMSAVLKGKLKEDAEVTRDSVAEALTSIGYEVEVEGAATESESEKSVNQEGLAKVSELSAKVRTTASGDAPDPIARLNQAATQADLVALTEELGLNKQHS